MPVLSHRAREDTAPILACQLRNEKPQPHAQKQMEKQKALSGY